MKYFNRTFALAVGFLILAAICVHVEAVDSWDNPFGVVNPFPGLKALGIQWCRCGGGATALGSWNRIEVARGEYNWETADNELALMQREGLTATPLLCYTPKWANAGGDIHDMPDEPLDFYHFVKTVARRYRGKIPAYEVWNEPNGRGTFFHGGCDELMLLMKLAYCAVRQADPDAKVIFPGLAGNDIEYLERSYELGAGNYFDILAIHPYQWGRWFDENHHSIKHLPEIRAVMGRYGDADKPIWANEFGWAVGKKISTEDQARLLVVGISYLRSIESLGIERIFWYNAKSWGLDFGLFDRNRKVRPAFFAYQTLVKQLGAKHFAGFLPVKNVKGLVFTASGKLEDEAAVVLWSSTHDGFNATLPVRKNATVQVTQIDGSLRTIKGGESIRIEPTPVFLQLPAKAIQELKPGPFIRPRRWAPRTANQEPFVFAQIMVPDGTSRLFVSPKTREIQVKVYNLYDTPRSGSLLLTSELLGESARVPFAMSRESAAVLKIPVTILRGKKSGLYSVSVQGQAGNKPLEMYTDRVRLCTGRAMEFRGNSWEESKYLLGKAPAGSPSTSFGNEWCYTFDLSNTRGACLKILVGANAAGSWSVQFSKDAKEFETMQKGRSWPGWRTIAIPGKYLGKNLIVRIHGKDCQLNYLVLEIDENLMSSDK